MAGAILQSGVTIGENSVVNTRASIDHHCLIESGVFISPGVVLCGGVSVEEGAFIGAGAVILKMLERAGLVDHIVVVTRWYGGVHLGGDRFAHIVTCTRAAVADRLACRVWRCALGGGSSTCAD